MNLKEMLQHGFLCSTPLPKQLPVSTLVCVPHENFAYAYNLPECKKQSTSNVFSPKSQANKHSAIKQVK
jgi:hypothetical protein